MKIFPCTKKLEFAVISICLAGLMMTEGLTREIHVAKTGNDGNSGSSSAPYLTISKAATEAQPGDIVTVHEGIYREWVKPPRGGNSEADRIVYQAAPGEQVTIKGSEQIGTGQTYSWTSEGGGVWRVDIPESFFGNYNPYTLTLQTPQWAPSNSWHHRGDVYLDGEGYYEKQTLGEVQANANSWCTSTNGGVTSIWANFGSTNPNTSLAEINVRHSVFAPVVTGRNYITVSGFTIMHSAEHWVYDVFNPGYTGDTQMGAIAPYWSRSWIIENCKISYARMVGICLGYVHDMRSQLSDESVRGHHIVRNNVIQKCGQAGINGQWGNVASEISGNLIEDINFRQEYEGAENAGIKLHYAIDVVIKNNCIRRVYSNQSWNCFGIWLDWGAQGTRVTGNIIYDIHGGETSISMEVDHGPILVDNNIVDKGMRQNGSEAVIYVHNLFYSGSTSRGDSASGPCFQPHTCILAGDGTNQRESNTVTYVRDDHMYNNICIGNYVDWRSYDSFPTTTNVDIDYNAYLEYSFRAANWDSHSIEDRTDTNFTIISDADGATVSFTLNSAPFSLNCPLITHSLIGLMTLTQQGIEYHDGSPITINSDYFGNMRNLTSPMVGPFENLKEGLNTFRVFPLSAPTPAKIAVASDKTTLAANGTDISPITAKVLSSNDVLVYDSTAEITFNITSGGGTLLGTNPVNASGGIAKITYQAGTNPETVIITATSPGLAQGTVNINVITNSQPLAPTNLLCNGQSNPTNLSDFTPDLSWTFNDPNKAEGDIQSAYRILVADSQTNINNNNGNMWDTNKVPAVDTTVTYTGTPLQANTLYWWKVMTWDSFDAQGPYSQAATFTTADMGDGLAVTYYDNMDFTGTTVTTIDPEVNFDWGNGSPDPSIGADSFSARWTGMVKANYSETYTFYVRVDDGARLWVDNQLIVESWQDQAPTEYSGTISLTAGSIYDIKLEYYESGGGAVIELKWSSPSTLKEIIPQANLYSQSGPTEPTITVINPNGGESWQVNTQQTVMWASQGTVGNTVGISLSTDGGSNWTTLVASTENDGTQVITVPDSPTTSGRIRVEDISGTPTDMSNNNFTISITPPLSEITVTSPNGGETWTANTQAQVIWTSQGSVGNIVNIDLSTDGGSNWTTLAGNTTNDGLETLTVPNSPSISCKIRVQVPSGTPSDTSDINFTIEASIEPESISVSPTALDFEEVEIGETSTLNFQITNTGGGILSGSISSDKKWITVQPTSFEGNTVLINVTVDNNVLNQTEGEYTGTISITSTGGNISVEVTLVATCVLPKPNPYDPSKGNLTFFGDGIVPGIPGGTTIRIYTLSGELVNVIDNVEASLEAQYGSGSKDPSTSKIIWNGKNENGETITSGIYIYTYESPKEKGVGKFTVTR